MTPKPTHSYIGRKACGCGVMLSVDDTTHPKLTGDRVASMIGAGLAVERVPFDDAVKGLKQGMDCTHERQPRLLME